MIIYYKDPNWNPLTLEPKKVLAQTLKWFLTLEDQNNKIILVNKKFIYFIEFSINSASLLAELDEYYAKI